MRAFIVTVLAFFLMGCAPPRTYIRPGASKDDFTKDSWDCQSYANTSPNQYAQGSVLAATSYYSHWEDCMLHKHGWNIEHDIPQKGFKFE